MLPPTVEDKANLVEVQDMVVIVKADKKQRPAVISSSTSSSMLQCPSRTFVKTILKTLLKLIIKLWRWASSFVIVIFFAAWFYGGILPYIVSIIAIFSLGYHISDTLLYQPDVPVESRLFVPSPQNYSLPYEAVTINTRDRVKLHAYLIKQQRPNSRHLPVVLYFHGNAGNIGHRLDNVKMFYQKLKCNILMLEYRGYGHSEGTPSESGFYLDAQAAFEFVDGRDDLDSNKIILFGRSLGGAVAIDMAARSDYRDRIAALIVENTFSSIPDLAKVLFPLQFIRWVPKFCFKNRYESLQKVSSVVCPAMFISGTKDELIPPTMMSDLYTRCASATKRLRKFPGGHNDTWLCKDYATQLGEFIEGVGTARPNGANYQPFSDDIV